VTIRTLALLDGCRFPLERFRVGGVAVERLARSVLEGLGPRRDVAQVFFQNEILDPEWYTQVWFLIAEEERQISPGSISFRLGYDVLNLFFQPITALALYKVDYFATPIVVESDPGWRLERVRWSEPIPALVDDGTGNALEIPRTDYDVDTQEQRRFSAFLTFFEEGTQSIRDWRRFRLAGRRYLRGMQIAGSHPSSTDDSEDALLQYVLRLRACSQCLVSTLSQIRLPPVRHGSSAPTTVFATKRSKLSSAYTKLGQGWFTAAASRIRTVR
jgi:hypothetical protein